MKSCTFFSLFLLSFCLIISAEENVTEKLQSKNDTSSDLKQTTSSPNVTTTNRSVATSNTSVRPVTNRATTSRPITHRPTTTNRPLIPGLKFPCSCLDGQCGCCTGAVLDRLRQKICLNFTYEPDDFSLSALMTMNGRILYRNTFSGKNPPPACVKVPRMNFIRLCVQFSNIYFASRNIHLCIDMAANWESVTLVHWSFDCIRMGAAGVAVVPPEAGGGLPPSTVDTESQIEEDYDDSARNIPNLRTAPFLPACLNDFNNVIFDDSLNELISEKPNKNLVTVKNINCDWFVSYNKTLRK